MWPLLIIFAALSNRALYCSTSGIQIVLDFEEEAELSLGDVEKFDKDMEDIDEGNMGGSEKISEVLSALLM